MHPVFAVLRQTQQCLISGMITVAAPPRVQDRQDESGNHCHDYDNSTFPDTQIGSSSHLSLLLSCPKQKRLGLLTQKVRRAAAKERNLESLCPSQLFSRSRVTWFSGLTFCGSHMVTAAAAAAAADGTDVQEDEEDDTVDKDAVVDDDGDDADDDDDDDSTGTAAAAAADDGDDDDEEDVVDDDDKDAADDGIFEEEDGDEESYFF